MDLNIQKYSIPDLVDIIEIKSDYTEKDVSERVFDLINSCSKQNDIAYIEFLEKAQSKLLEAITTAPEYVKKYYEDKNYDPNRSKGSYILGNGDVLDKAPLDGIGESFSVPVKKGQLNPNVHNLNERIINIDSQFRPDFLSQTQEFTLDLTTPLDNVIEMNIQTIELCKSWYLFDENYGTNYFCVDGSCVEITNGNYGIDELIDELNNVSSTNGFDISFSYNTVNSKVSITNNGVTDKTVTLYDFDANNNSHRNFTLGWIMGFNDISFSIASSGVVEANRLVDLCGFKYLMVGIDDFNQNQVNPGIVSMADNKEFFKFPDYVKGNLNVNNPCENCDGTPSGLTEAQIATVKSIQEAKNQGFENIYHGSNDTNIIAKIPLPQTNVGEKVSLNNTSLQNNKRVYLGPVNIKRLKLTLYNDKGQKLNLNGVDWSLSLQTKHLYQY